MKILKKHPALFACAAAWLLAFALNGQANILVSAALFPIFFFLPGYLFLKLIWGKTPKLKWGEGVLLSIGLSVLIAYPLGVLNNAVELLAGQNPIQNHRDTMVLIYGAATGLLYWLGRGRKKFHEAMPKVSKGWIFFVLGAFALGLLFRLYHIELQNINGDEQELNLIAYHLVDGILAGRKALLLSSTHHSPLGFFASFISLQMLTPLGHETLNEWMLRSPMILFGLFELGIFLLFAKRLALSKPLTGFGLLLLAVNTYAIFGSRLFIPQDGSIFTFFVLLFMYFLVVFLQDNEKLTRTQLLILSLLLSATLLVKFSAVLLIPVLLILWIGKNKSWKQLGWGTALTLLFFSPVIAFNIGAYLFTGYTDVPFSKLFNMVGIPAQSIMASENIYGSEFPPFFTNLLGIPHMLIDQWTIEFMITFAASLILLGLTFKKLKTKRFLMTSFLVLGVVTWLFFTLNGYRAYYMEYLTVPAILIILVAFSSLVKRKEWWLRAPLAMWVILLLFGTSYYSVQTHWVVQDFQIGTPEYGRNQLYAKEELVGDYSLASQFFLRPDGYPELRDSLENYEGLLVIDKEFFFSQLHHLRWYLGIARDIEAHYLGDKYEDRINYALDDDFVLDQDALYLMWYDEAHVQEGDQIIRNHLDSPKMILRQI